MHDRSHLPSRARRILACAFVVLAGAAAPASAADLAHAPGSPFPIGEDNSTPVAGEFNAAGDLYAYVNFQRGQLNVFRVDRATGTLTRMHAPVPSGSGSQDLAWSPTSNLLAVSSDEGHTNIRVAMFRVDRDAGTVTPVSGSPFMFPAGATGLSSHDSLVFHPSGDFLASGDSLGSVVHLFRVNQSTGGVTEVAGSPKTSHPNGPGSGNDTNHLAFSPDGTLLASANAGSNGCCGTTVSMFKVDAQAGSFARTTQGAMTVGTKPKAVSFSPSGQRLLITLSETANPINLGKLALVDVDPGTGEMSRLQTSDPGPAQPFASAKFSPFGSLIAVAASYPLGGPNVLSVYEFDEPSLHPVSGSPFSVPDLGPAGADALAWSPAGGVVATVAGFGQKISVFTSPPSAAITTPAGGATYRQGATVTADYACADGIAGPGIDTCSGPVADGAAVNTSTPGEHTFTVTATSKDGLKTQRSVTYRVAEPPTATITTPADGASYEAGEVVTADYACAEGAGGPGLASCLGTVADGSPIDTSTLGTRQFSVTARSTSGAETTKTVSYTVTRAATRLTATPPNAGVSAKLVLARDNTPIAGAQLRFTAGANVLCEATTDASGVARCPDRTLLIAVLIARGYRVDYAGSATYLPSTTTMSLFPTV